MSNPLATPDSPQFWMQLTRSEYLWLKNFFEFLSAMIQDNKMFEIHSELDKFMIPHMWQKLILPGKIGQ